MNQEKHTYRLLLLMTHTLSYIRQSHHTYDVIQM